MFVFSWDNHIVKKKRRSTIWRRFFIVRFFINITVLDPDSSPVKNAVISVMVEGQLIGKGISDDNGKYAASLDIVGTPVLDIYANKAGFIQGHEALSVQSSQADIVLTDVNVVTENNIDKPVLGSLTSLSMTFSNESSNSVGAFNCNIAFSEHVIPDVIDIELPALEPGDMVTLDNVEFTAYGTDISNSIIGVITKEDGSTLCDFAIDFEMPVFGLIPVASLQRFF